MKSMRNMCAALALVVLSTSPAWAAGAIAVDDEEGRSARDVGYGIGWGTTREAAAAAAMKQCRSAGNEACEVVARFDTCGAYAGNRTNSGAGWGRTEEAAKAMALEKCGASSCRIIVAECE